MEAKEAQDMADEVSTPRRSQMEPEKNESDPNEPETVQGQKRGFYFAMAFAAIAIVAFTSAVDATILAVALPVVAEDLHMTSLESFWAGIAYLLTAVLFQPLHTVLSDIIGRKVALYQCIAFFTIGSIMVGAAPNANVLLAGRAIQGVGGGGMEALCEVILTDITTLKERPLFIGLLGLCWAAGSVLAPIIGGAFSEYATWRWAAWINLPLMGIAMLIIPFFLTLKEDTSSLLQKLKRVDWIGIFLFMAGGTSFILALAWGGQMFSWTAWQTLFPLILGVALLAGFAWFETRHPEPAINPRLFRTRTSSIAYLGSFIQGIVIWALVYYLVLYFQGALQVPPFQATILAFPLAFTLTPFAVIAAIAISIVRNYMWSVWLGWILTTAGVASMVVLTAESSKALYSGLQIMPGIGQGILLSALAVPLQASLSVDDVGVGMGMLVTFRSLGAVVGTTIGSAIFTNRFQEQLSTIAVPPGITLPDASDAVYFLTQIKDLDIPDSLRAQFLELYAGPIKYIWIVVAALSGVGLITSLFMKELTLERIETGKQAFENRSQARILENRSQPSVITSRSQPSDIMNQSQLSVLEV